MELKPELMAAILAAINAYMLAERQKAATPAEEAEKIAAKFPHGRDSGKMHSKT